jgi:hypothetical protein
MSDDWNVNILKSLWTRRPDGRWGIHDMKGIALKPRAGEPKDFFRFESDMELLSSTPPRNLGDFFSSFGYTDLVLKQSILPVVAWIDGAPTIRCIGTAFIVSCSGYVITAAHVVLDPQESGYAEVAARDGNTDVFDGIIFGVLMPVHPAIGQAGFEIIPFERASYWGMWKKSPLIHEPDRLESLTDVAICKLRSRGDGGAYQPLHLSLNPFSIGEKAYAVGYAEMKDIPIDYVDGEPRISKYEWEPLVSTGHVSELVPMNHINKEVPTPGPCFNFKARIPGKMSGSPIFGADGAVVRGVVSRSSSGEKDAYGCMLGPVMSLARSDGPSLGTLMKSGQEGMAVTSSQGL